MNGNFSGLALCGALLTGSLAWAQPAFTEFAIPAAGSHPQAISPGPDDAIWFTDPGTNSIGRIGPSGASYTITEYPIPTAASGPSGITQGIDGAIWFTETIANKIGRITTAGVFTEYPLPTPSSAPTGISFGSDGGVWFTEAHANQIGNIGPTGVLTEYPIPTPSSTPLGITWDIDGAIWFTEQSGNKIGRITTNGAITEYPIPTAQAGAFGITLENRGAIWITEAAANKVAFVTTTVSDSVDGVPFPPGTFFEYPIPTAAGGASGITSGACFTLFNANLIECVSGGSFVEYPIPTPSSGPQGITLGSGFELDGYWFTEATAGKIGRLVPPGGIAAQPRPYISTSPTLPPGLVGMPYSVSLAVTSGTPPYTWSALPGSLPAGLMLSTNLGGFTGSATATISGTPTVSGPQTFTVSLTDANSIMVAQTFTMQIGAANCTFAISSSGQAFPSVGGAGNFFLTAPAGCPWAVSGLPDWVHIETASSGTGSGSVNYFVGPNSNAAPLSVTLSFGGQPFTIHQESGPAPVCCLIRGNAPGPFNFMPHLAAEGGWRTMFTLVNTGSTSIDTSTVVYGNDGNLLPLSLTFPQQSSQSPVTEAWVDRTLAPNQSLIFEVSGPANVPFVQGSAQFWAAAIGVDGFAIFHFDPSGQEAVVPLGGSGYVIPFDNTNGVLTGIAVENTSPFTSTFPVVLLDDTGKQIGTGTDSITMSAYGHTSFVLSTEFPMTANIRGKLILGKCVSIPSPGFPGGFLSCTSISTLGIRYTPPGTLTTIPSLADVGPHGGWMPHVASGNGWQTTFVLVNSNPSGLPAQAQLNFFDDHGNPLALPLTFPQTGTAATESSVVESIARGASLWVQTSGALGTALLAGSAQLTTTGGVSGFAIFRYNPNGQEAVVPMETSSASAYLLAFDNTNGTATGVAVANATTQMVNIPVIVRDDTGAQIGTGSIPLAANGHTSFMLASQFPVTAGIRGTVEFDTPPGGQISALGLRATPAGTLTTIPVLRK